MLINAAKLFLTHGYDKFTMEQLANELGVSKSTIYKEFRNKEDLISHVLETRKQLFYGMAKQIRVETENALQNFFRFRKAVNVIVPIKQQRQNLLELKNTYPKLYKRGINDVREITSVCFEAIYLRGLEEGLFRREDSQEIGEHYAKIFLDYRLDKNHYDHEKLLHKVDMITLIFIRGLLSPKGLTVFEYHNDPFEM